MSANGSVGVGYDHAASIASRPLTTTVWWRAWPFHSQNVWCRLVTRSSTATSSGGK